jgi:hypothetical protein
MQHVRKWCRVFINGQAGQRSTLRAYVNAVQVEELILENQQVTVLLKQQLRDHRLNSDEVEVAVHEWLQMKDPNFCCD